eukprot:14714267-Alexandrium_andersonii.AAC.1
MSLRDYTLAPSSAVAIQFELRNATAQAIAAYDSADFGTSSIWLPALSYYTQCWMAQAREVELSS